MLIAKNITTDDAQISNVGRYFGYSARATAAGYVTLRSGAVDGPIVAHIEFVAAGQKEFSLSRDGVACGALYANLESGTFPTGIVIYFQG